MSVTRGLLNQACEQSPQKEGDPWCVREDELLSSFFDINNVPAEYRFTLHLHIYLHLHLHLYSSLHLPSSLSLFTFTFTFTLHLLHRIGNTKKIRWRAMSETLFPCRKDYQILNRFNSLKKKEENSEIHLGS
jgi:hypothetical protein